MTQKEDLSTTLKVQGTVYQGRETEEEAGPTGGSVLCSDLAQRRLLKCLMCSVDGAVGGLMMGEREEESWRGEERGPDGTASWGQAEEQ